MGCLLDYRSRPQTKALNFEGVSVADVVANCKSYRSALATPLATPEHEAIEFYLLNAAFAELSIKLDNSQALTPAEDLVLARYYECLTRIGHRAFFYLFLICTREARHWVINSGTAKADLEAKYGQKLNFFKSIPDSSSEIVEHLTTHTPQFSLKDFTALLVDVFNNGTFGHAYGGKKWGACAQPLKDFVHGVTTIEMMLDTVWTLAHNTAPIFNKGMLYKTQNQGELLKILDVQRGGMIPNLVAHGESNFVVTSHEQILTQVRQVLPDFGVAPVDWDKIKALGAKGHHKSSKKLGTTLAPSLQAHANQFKVTPSEAVLKISRAEVKAA